MRATGEIQVIPIGTGVSVRAQVQLAHGMLADSGLHVELHGQGTNVEGELSEILNAVEGIHEALHAQGVIRLATFVKVGTRLDKEPSLAAKLF